MESGNYTLSSTLHTKNHSLIIYIICIFVTLLCIVFAYSFSKSIARPLHSLSKICSKIIQGDLSIRGKTTAKVPTDEISILVNLFNTMIETIEQSMKELQEKSKIEQQLKEEQLNNKINENMLKDAELKFLQMQINPHFLFNTFNSISALSKIEDSPLTTAMIESLSHILRYSLSEFDKTVVLNNELTLVKNYLHIQKIRFQDRLNFEIDIPNSLLQTNVPSMILQPIVENAILHGIEPTEFGGTIKITATCSPTMLYISISDDGIGMDENKLEILRTNTDESKHDTQCGIGLANVKKRLELTYGHNMLDFDSKLGIGTTITINIPINKTL